MAGKCARHWPVLCVLALMWLVLFGLVVTCSKATHGHLIYGLDDAYIHMAMAKNLATDGVWGITRHEFSSSSSSVLWTLLLAAVYRVSGASEIAPLILNWLFASIAVVIGYLYLVKMRISGPRTLIILTVMMFGTSMPALAFIGMEHTMHAALALLLLYLASEYLSLDKVTSRSALYSGLIATAFFLSAARYEGMFMIVMVSGLCVVRGRWRQAAAICAAGIAPLIIFGFISHNLGSFWLPNGVLIKADVTGAAGASIGLKGAIWNVLIRTYESAPYLSFLVVGALIAYVLRSSRERYLWERNKLALAIFAGSSVLHLIFAKVGWFWRYEAYLMAMGTLTVGCETMSLLKNPEYRLSMPRSVRVAAVLAVLVIWMPTFIRAERAIVKVPKACRNIYEQQYQMALFLSRSYPGQAIAANDIGAMNYLADIHCIDLAALGSIEVTRQRIKGTFNTAFMGKLCRERGVKIAMIYDNWFQGQASPPKNWTKVGAWTIRDNEICGGDTVSFYAVDPTERPHLVAALAAFTSSLPKGVKFTTAAVSTSEGSADQNPLAHDRE